MGPLSLPLSQLGITRSIQSPAELSILLLSLGVSAASPCMVVGGRGSEGMQ